MGANLCIYMYIILLYYYGISNRKLAHRWSVYGINVISFLWFHCICMYCMFTCRLTNSSGLIADDVSGSQLPYSANVQCMFLILIEAER